MSLSQEKTTKDRELDRIRMMASVFGTPREWESRERTGNVAYDTTAALCDYMHMEVVPYRSMTESYGEKFGCRDVARASHITTRNVRLSGYWHKYSSQSFIGFSKEDGHPLLCIPSGRDSSMVYDFANDTSFKVTKKTMDLLDGDGILFYRSLPPGPLTMKEVFAFGGTYIRRSDVINMLFMTLLSTLVGLLIPILNEQLFDKLIPMGSYKAIVQIGVMILACSLGNVLFLLVRNLNSFRSVSVAQYAITDATLDRLFHLPQSFIDRFGSIDLVSRAFGVQDAMSAVSNQAMTASAGALLSLIYLIRMIRKSGKLTIAALVMMLITALVTLFAARARRRYEKVTAEESCVNRNLLTGFITGIMKIRLSRMEDRVLFDYQKHNTESVRSQLESVRISNFSSSFTALMSVLYATVIYYIVMKKHIALTMGEFTGFFTAFGLFNSAVMQLCNFLVTIPQIRPVLDRAMPIYQQGVEDEHSGGSTNIYSGRLDVDKLEFSYTDSERKILRDISFHVDAGEYIGIVGPSGCGKSTLLKLLLGFEEPTAGKIYYDDHDLETVDKLDLRKQMGVVLQNGRMTIGTIYENVALANPDITEDRVKELLAEVGMGPDLERMPMGIYTMVSEFGGSVSGGQQQRILIARALANEPCMLLFDEATSALDNRAQAVLCETLKARNITRIVIAHRLSTVRRCDRILVMENGRIVEEGRYEELAAAGGLFSEMVKTQMIGQAEVSG